ncbi:MAG TPA: imidazolonepropionase [Terriglobales bacterium]|nr:imidazolonepropionase [Terriglobales bacterium]
MVSPAREKSHGSAPGKRTADSPSILLTNIRQLISLRGPVSPRRGRELSELGIIEDAAVLCVGGKIVSVGSRREAQRDAWIQRNRHRIRTVDCRGGVVLPGFVDSHTHPVFTEARLVDFEKRISGASYEGIAEAGGGIRSSLNGVRESSRKELSDHVLSALRRMSASGTTTVEAKSGYGLSMESEIKSLEAIRDAARQWPGTVVPTLLGAHVIPPEFRDRREDYVALICEKMIPEAARRKLAEYVDVFCERGAFAVQETQGILASAKHHGLATRVHICQLSEARLGDLAQFQPHSYDHMDFVTEVDLADLAKMNAVATLLPAANYFLGLQKYPPARNLIDAGVAVALATDYNPGSSPTTNMPFVLSIACTHMKMSPAEVITATTCNGACALRLQNRKGSIEPGKDADLAVFAVRDYREIAYWVAADLCSGTIAGGQLFSAASSTSIQFE